MSDTVVGVAEIAEHAGVKPDTVQQWRIRNLDFPAPEHMLAMGPVWKLSVVVAWLEKTGRYVERRLEQTGRQETQG